MMLARSMMVKMSVIKLVAVGVTKYLGGAHFLLNKNGNGYCLVNNTSVLKIHGIS